MSYPSVLTGGSAILQDCIIFYVVLFLSKTSLFYKVCEKKNNLRFYYKNLMIMAPSLKLSKRTFSVKHVRILGGFIFIAQNNSSSDLVKLTFLTLYVEPNTIEILLRSHASSSVPNYLFERRVSSKRILLFEFT